MQIDASALPRTVQCGASLTMPAIPPAGMVQSSDDREEGIAAHWLGKQVLSRQINNAYLMVDRKAPNGFYISGEMAEHVDNYYSSVMSVTGNKFIEQTMSFDMGPDTRILARPDVITDNQRGGIITIEEFKYGWSIVEPDNWTMKAYAMAFCSTRSFSENVMFVFRIHQPRPYHPDGPIRRFTMMYSNVMALQLKLYNWLIANENTLATGPECKYCPARGNCPAARQAAMNAVDMSQQKFVDDLPSADISMMLDEIEIAKKRLESYYNALKEVAYTRLMKGDRIANYKLEPSSGNLEWKPWVTPETLQSVWPDKALTKRTAITPTQAKKLIGEDAIKSMADRPSGGLKLVRYDPQKEAQRMFGDASTKETS